MMRISLFFIRMYQKLFSPETGILGMSTFSVCRFYPTCSVYMADSIKKKGVFRGVLKGVLRIMRCNPWYEGGYDPVIMNHEVRIMKYGKK
jgi:uncharacterized protein